MKRILLTGGAGYIGSVLTKMLLERGYEVIVLDRLFFGDNVSYLKETWQGLRVVKGDIRNFDLSTLPSYYAVMDLASISNDPAGELDQEKTREINHRGRVRIAKLSKILGAKRYILASSCSVYGFQEGLLDECSNTNPLTTYAKANCDAEQDVLELADEKFCVTCLRQATLYGLSRRMRFDLAINGMTLGLIENNKIPILRDGTQWRPMLHIVDTCRAFINVLEQEKAKVNGEIFNVGSEQQNYQILPLAKILAEALGKEFNYEWYGDPDHRSYRVSFQKIESKISFNVENFPGDEAKKIEKALCSKKIEANDITRTVVWYKKLLKWNKVIDEVRLNGGIL